MTLFMGGHSYPLTLPPGSQTLLPVADKFSAVFLDYWQACLNAYLAAAFHTAMAGQDGDLPAATAACQQTTNVDPMVWLRRTGFRFPLLACVPDRGIAVPSDKHTQHWWRQDTEYLVTYVLPPLDADTAERASPMLHAVRSLLLVTLERCGDPAWQSGANPLTAAGIMGCTLRECRYGLADGGDTARDYPVLEARVLVHERSGDDLAGATLTQQALTASVTNPESADAFDVAASYFP